ncbi:MAG: hypothetical protein P8P74_06075 [Crocinitomicaceae bacterium]|nr:hypothetical protein [Crocinitomicaceae bacterium]
MSKKQEIMWQELVEAKDFDQLSNAENAFVLGISSEENYRLERSAILEAKVIYADANPRPLILEEVKKGIVIPLYQTLIAVAASFVLGFFLFKSTQTTTETEKNPTLATTDTVYVEKQIIDTVIQTKTEYIQLAAKQTDSKAVQVQSPKAAPSAVLGNQGDFETDLSAATLANKGKSAAKDETLIFVEDWVAPN